jgi:hypothetical protein
MLRRNLDPAPRKGDTTCTWACHKGALWNAGIALMDVIGVLILLFMRRRFCYAIKAYTEVYDKKVVELSDYTALITGLPANLTPEEVEAGLHECGACSCMCSCN